MVEVEIRVIVKIEVVYDIWILIAESKKHTYITQPI